MACVNKLSASTAKNCARSPSARAQRARRVLSLSSTMTRSKMPSTSRMNSASPSVEVRLFFSLRSKSRQERKDNCFSQRKEEDERGQELAGTELAKKRSKLFFFFPFSSERTKSAEGGVLFCSLSCFSPRFARRQRRRRRRSPVAMKQQKNFSALRSSRCRRRVLERQQPHLRPPPPRPGRRRSRDRPQGQPL